MSTTFHVIPTTAPPDTSDILRAAETRIVKFLAAQAIPFTAALTATWFDGDDRHPLTHGPFLWPNSDDSYLWITLDGIPGGTDVYAEPIFIANDPCTILQDFRDAPRLTPAQAPILDRAAEQNLTWTFRRSMGQEPITTLSYGLIAATLAELTGGLVLSYDGGWDYQRFPATGAEMCSWYFHPDQALSPATANWAERCIERIRRSAQTPPA